MTTLLSDLRGSGQLTELALGPLDAADTAELAVRVAGRKLDPDETRRLFDETEGQPLFVVETIRALVGSSDHAPLPTTRPAPGPGPGRLPPKVHAVIAARLAQLSDSTREIVRLAATIGRSFTLDLLIDASGSDIDAVVAAIDELWQRHIVREHGTSAYDFSHDRIREVASTDMSAARRSMLHRRVAQALERGSGANGDGVSAQVAAHHEQAGLPAQAVPYYRRAAELAQRVHAHHEAIHLLRRGLDLLAGRAPGQERDAQELAMQTALGTSHVATVGYGAPAAAAPYRRAQELCRQLEQPPSPPILRGVAIASISHAHFDQAQDFGDQLLSLASERNDPMLLVEGHYVLGVALFWKGALVASRQHLEQALGDYPSGGSANHLSLYTQDPRVVCANRLAVDLWLLGHPRDARAKMTEALGLAHELAHPFSLTYALSWGVWLAVLERDIQLVLEASDEGITLCRENGIDVWLGALYVGRGWALGERGDAPAGISLMHERIAAHRATGNVFHLPWYMGLLAEQYGKIAQTDQGLRTISDALAAVERTGERWCEAELYRHREVRPTSGLLARVAVGRPSRDRLGLGPRPKGVLLMTVGGRGPRRPARATPRRRGRRDGLAAGAQHRPPAARARTRAASRVQSQGEPGAPSSAVARPQATSTTPTGRLRWRPHETFFSMS